MSKQPESRLQARARKRLQREFGGFWFKVHGGPFQRAGLPDHLGCVEGWYVAIEWKMPGEQPSELQKFTIRQILDAGGIAFVADDIEEAITRLARELARRRKEVRAQGTGVGRRLRPAVRARNWQDLRYAKAYRGYISRVCADHMPFDEQGNDVG